LQETGIDFLRIFAEMFAIKKQCYGYFWGNNAEFEVQIEKKSFDNIFSYFPACGQKLGSFGFFFYFLITLTLSNIGSR
jgi:hypothetical protein